MTEKCIIRILQYNKYVRKKSRFWRTPESCDFRKALCMLVVQDKLGEVLQKFRHKMTENSYLWKDSSLLHHRFLTRVHNYKIHWPEAPRILADLWYSLRNCQLMESVAKETGMSLDKTVYLCRYHHVRFLESFQKNNVCSRLREYADRTVYCCRPFSIFLSHFSSHCRKFPPLEDCLLTV